MVAELWKLIQWDYYAIKITGNYYGFFLQSAFLFWINLELVCKLNLLCISRTSKCNNFLFLRVKKVREEREILLKRSFKHFKIIFKYESMYGYVDMSTGACRNHSQILLELEWKAVVSCLVWMLGTKFRYSRRLIHVLYYWDIFSTPPIFFFFSETMVISDKGVIVRTLSLVFVFLLWMSPVVD